MRGLDVLRRSADDAPQPVALERLAPEHKPGAPRSSASRATAAGGSSGSTRRSSGSGGGSSGTGGARSPLLLHLCQRLLDHSPRITRGRDSLAVIGLPRPAAHAVQRSPLAAPHAGHSTSRTSVLLSWRLTPSSNPRDLNKGRPPTPSPSFRGCVLASSADLRLPPPVRSSWPPSFAGHHPGYGLGRDGRLVTCRALTLGPPPVAGQQRRGVVLDTQFGAMHFGGRAQARPSVLQCTLSLDPSAPDLRAPGRGEQSPPRAFGAPERLG